MSIKSLARQKVIRISRKASLRDAAQMMRLHHVGALVVVQPIEGHERLVGIITDRDLAIQVISEGLDVTALRVEDVMSHEVVTLNENMGLLEALKFLRRNGVRRAPVLDHREHIVGFISADDVIDLLAQELAELRELNRQEFSNERTAHSSAASWDWDWT